jgi:hypothetical protein
MQVVARYDAAIMGDEPPPCRPPGGITSPTLVATGMVPDAYRACRRSS